MSEGDLIDVCVTGFGAIGALYAFALDRSRKVRITAVCRSNFNILQEHGLDFVSDKLGSHTAWKPFRVVRTVEEAADRPYAYVVCAFKCLPDIITTPDLLSPLLTRLQVSQSDAQPTTFVLLQNGIGIEDDLLSALATLPAPTVVLSGCCWVDTTAVDAGRRVTQFGNERLVLGFHRPPASARFSEEAARASLNALCGMLRAAGNHVEAAPDVDIARWRKVLWNASFSTICTLTRAHVGEILANPAGRAALADVMREVLTVARAVLPPSSEVETVLSNSVVEEILAHENPKSVFRPSMLVDLDAGRPMEVEAIVGGVLKRARAQGVAAPRLELIYAGLSVIQNAILVQRA